MKPLRPPSPPSLSARPRRWGNQDHREGCALKTDYRKFAAVKNTCGCQRATPSRIQSAGHTSPSRMISRTMMISPSISTAP
jgi:hypothetical protein